MKRTIQSKGTKAYAYVRVSSKVDKEKKKSMDPLHDKIDGAGLDRQLEIINDFARNRRYCIIDTFQDEISGTTDLRSRIGFQQMKEAILGNGVKTVIVERLDRLSRDLMQQLIALVYLEELGIILIDAGTGDNVTEAMKEDPMRKAFVQMRAMFAELEKSMTVQRMRDGKERKRKQGKKVDGRKPYGESAEEREVLRRMHMMRRTRKGGFPGMKLQEIADQLNREGIPTKSEKQWTASLVHNMIHRNYKRRYGG